jgi:thiol-disulfide isomerase/thioredoxin
VVSPPSAASGTDPARFHALLLNGGGNPGINFQPHVLHLRAMRDRLRASGVPESNISIFSSDGADPNPDMVEKAPQAQPDFWLLQGTHLEHPLETRRQFVSSQVPGAKLLPATRAELKKWFDAEAHTLVPGDTLFLYVTDHGNRTSQDPLTNTIQLWGQGEVLSVNDLRDLLRELPAGVRIVSLMSQCFSGAFADLSLGDKAVPDACGYFASPADRPAYGCFPENVGKEKVGHSFDFLRALHSTRRLAEAHDEVLVIDDSPDVPLRSSDVFLGSVLHGAAEARKVSDDALVAELVGSGWQERPEYKAEKALADRIATAFGLATPATFRDLDAQGNALSTLGHSFDAAARAWRSGLVDVTEDNLTGFLSANPSWGPRVSDPALQGLNGDSAEALATALLADLGPWTKKERGDRLQTLDHQAQVSEDAGYRTEVRLAAALRLRVLLYDLAGRAYLEASGSEEDRARYKALRACEDLELPPPLVAADGGASDDAASDSTPTELAFPPLADEVKLATDVRPPWIGITFGQLRDDLRKERKLASGALLVTSVYPSSPASDAGIQIGDVLLGPPGKPFTGKNEIRDWTMLSPPGASGTMDVLRGQKKLEVALTPRPLPSDLQPPPPPRGPAVDSPAPAVSLRAYRGGSVNLKDGKSHLLLFWATWCKPCKASLPEVLAFEKAHHAEVVAITNESPATLDAFFKDWKKPFPRTVAIDDYNLAFLSYGVTGTPGFVLIDGKGIVRARSTGYANPPGLPIEGWKWTPPKDANAK